MYCRRRIPFTGTHNTRDLGGYPISAAHRTKYGVFLRSDLPTAFNESEEKLLQEMDIKTIIDLRNDEELARMPCHFQSSETFTYHHFSLSGTEEFDRHGEEGIPKSYFKISQCPNMPKILKIIANSPGGCLYHCAAGKDRTGVVSALLLMTAGVTKADIISDYCVSDIYLTELISMLKTDFPDLPAYVGLSKPYYMANFLDLFEEKYKNIDNYFSEIGLSADEVNSLRQKLVTVN